MASKKADINRLVEELNQQLASSARQDLMFVANLTFPERPMVGWKGPPSCEPLVRQLYQQAPRSFPLQLSPMVEVIRPIPRRVRGDAS